MAASVVSFATQHIESKINEGSNALVNVKSEANALLSELKYVSTVLVGAEERTGLSSNYEFRSWFRELRRISYEAEDEVDTLVSESSPLSLRYFSPRFHRASKKLRDLKERTKMVKKKLEDHAEGSKGSNKEVKSRARGSMAPKGHLPAKDDLVIGIEDEITRVIDQLTGQQVVYRLAIVGMGGSGKTTLARSIYNHKAVKRHFHFQAWVSVSPGWDTSSVFQEIIAQIRGQKTRFDQPSTNNEELEHEHEHDEFKMFLSKLDILLNKKTCLLVLDDVWDMESLQKFIGLIQREGHDSRTYTIVITSRQTPIDRTTWCIHKHESLTDEDCWKLFSKVASNSPKALSIDYRPLAMEMLKRCEGLPLAIVALGRLLKTKDTMPEWRRVLYQIEGAEAASMYGPVNEVLGLSYDELPYYLKPCFLYLGLFPEGSTISGGTLIRMWIAEGFVERESNSEDTLEVAGREYLKKLIDYNMVQVVKKTYSGKAKRIRIHDIMRDFCISKARDMDFLGVSSIGPEAIGNTSRRVAVNLSKSLVLPTNSTHLRSLMLSGQSSSTTTPERHSNLVNQRYQDLAQVHQMYKLLRVLDIVGIKTSDGTLPREIGKLIHLTYLRIRSTNIRELPKSIGKLRNLLTLDYWDVFSDMEVQVPNVLWKLEKLRHLFLPNEMSGSVENLRLDTLKDLITLWGVGGGHWMLKEMCMLSTTLRKLYIHRISTEDQLKAVLRCPSMTENGCLYALALDWYGFEIKNLEALCSRQRLQKLRLIGKAPDLLYSQGCKFPSKLGKLELYYTQLEKAETMSLLGELAFLKVLRLSKNSYIGSEWRCTKNAFPALEELKLANLPKLQMWEIEEKAFPCLKRLSIVSCITLKGIPKGLKLVRNLDKLDIERMPSSFNSRLQRAKEGSETREGEDFHIIEHIPQIVVRNSSLPLSY